MFKIVSALCIFMITACVTNSEQSYERVGDVYEISLKRVGKASSEGSSSSFNTQYTLTEKVVALRSDGLELEYDLPFDTSLEDRAKEWQFPVRVLKQIGHPLELLNRQQLQERIQTWLVKWDIPKEACGQRGFTWTVIKIECDPESVLGGLEPFDLRYEDIHEGALYSEPFAVEPVRLHAKKLSSGRLNFVARMNIDPNAMRRVFAEREVVSAEILGKDEVTFERALQQLSTQRISGTITTIFDVNEFGQVTGRTRITEILAVDRNGDVERENTTETVQRERINKSE